MKRPKKNRTAQAAPSDVAASVPQPGRGQLIASSVLLGLWLLFLLAMAVDA